MSAKRRLTVIEHPVNNRAPLGAAIKAAAAATAAVGERRKEVEKARSAIAEAESALELARTNAVEVVERAADAPTDSSSSAPAAMIGDARAAVVAAEDELEVRRTRLTRRQASVREAEQEERVAPCVVEGEVNGVFAHEAVARLLPVAEAALRTLATTTAVLRYLYAPGFEGVSVPEGLDWQRRNELNAALSRRAPPGLEERLRRLLDARPVFFLQFDQPAEITALVGSWREARAKLRSDPSAELPPLPGET